MHRDVRPVPVHLLNQSISPELEQILNKVLSKEPSSRYRSADQLGRILISFIRLTESYDSVIPSIPAQPVHTTLPPYQAPQPTPTPRPRPVQNTLPSVKPVIIPQAISSKPTQPAEEQANFDWMTVGLGLMAALSLSGLVPFWLFIWFRFNSTPPLP
jgi:serine/threonine protein kinase